MIYLPDTNLWIYHLKQPNSLVTRRLLTCPPGRVLLCDIVKAELFYGAYKSAAPTKNLAVLDSLFSVYPSLSFDGRTARVFGSLRADLARKGTPIGPLDLQIASIAMFHDCILVTHNTGEFSRIDGLRVEDWEME